MSQLIDHNCDVVDVSLRYFRRSQVRFLLGTKLKYIFRYGVPRSGCVISIYICISATHITR